MTARSATGDGFGIFDAFPDDEARQAHLDGPIAAALMASAAELLVDHEAQRARLVTLDREHDADNSALASEPRSWQGLAVKTRRMGFVTLCKHSRARRRGGILRWLMRALSRT